LPHQAVVRELFPSHRIRNGSLPPYFVATSRCGGLYAPWPQQGLAPPLRGVFRASRHRPEIGPTGFDSAPNSQRVHGAPCRDERPSFFS